MVKNKTQIKAIFDILSSTITNPETELKYEDDFTLLVAIILSAQSTDKTVNKATEKLFLVAKTPKDFLNLGLDGLKSYIKTIGLFNSKAKNIIGLSQILENEYEGKVPVSFEKLIKLPGVGRKSASVFLNTAYQMPYIAVDTHVFRVSNRIGLVKAQNVLETEKQLFLVAPKEHLVNISDLLVLHGRYTCKAKKPNCKNCGIEKFCDYNEKIL
jgi:endonuclease-3